MAAERQVFHLCSVIDSEIFIDTYRVPGPGLNPEGRKWMRQPLLLRSLQIISNVLLD